MLGCPSDRGATGAQGGAGAASTGSGTGGTGSPGNDAGDDATTVVAAGVRWVGRVDTSSANAPRFAWTGAGFSAKFSGTSVGVDLKNDDAYFFQAVIDGKKMERFQAAKGRAVRTVATSLAAGSHTLELYREVEASFGTSQFFGITEGTLEAPPPSRARLIEFVGDSITAGYGNLGHEPHPNYGTPSPCHFSFDTQSGFMSYGAVAARALAADASIVAASGWGVYRSRTGDMNDVLPKVYTRALGMTAAEDWDFRTRPQAVVINLGTNDFNPGDPGDAYAAALGTFVDTVRARNPSAWIFCAVGTMYTTAQHGKALSYTQSVVNARGADASRLAVVDLGMQDALQGTGCDWHPSVAENERMADVLVPVLKQKLGW
jgi:lysophospholipase L1-like esterase